jgi:cell division topological specificity factor
MREELLAVVRKYVQIPDDAVEVKVQREDGIEVLELAITLPDQAA